MAKKRTKKKARKGARKVKRKPARKAKARKPKVRKVKKAAAKKPAAIILRPEVPTLPTFEKVLVGRVAHFYNKINVAVIDITDNELKVGDEISIEGPHTNVRQKVDSMQIEHEQIQVANPGQSIGLKVNDRVREKDNVYKIVAATPAV